MKTASRLYPYCFVLFSLCFSACSSSPGQQSNKALTTAPTQVAAPALQDTFRKGVVLNSIVCQADAGVSYALYLPASYNIQKSWPVMLFFDAHARGKLPLDKYKELADKYGYIFIGSNNSKNGMSMDETQRIFGALLTEAGQRFAIDQKRIYTCGFSGGAKVATAAAIAHPSVTGVIGCTSGFTSQPGSASFDYIGMIGNGDFNYQEMLSQDAALQAAHISHQLIVFDGKHEWPPVGELNDALIWMQFNAMRSNKLPKDEQLIKSYVSSHEAQYDKDQKQGRKLEAYRGYRQISSFVKNLYDASDIDKKAATLGQSPEIRKVLAEQETIKGTESSQQHTYVEAMSTKDASWWRNEITSLQNKSSNKNDVQAAALNRRLLAYINMIMYMQTSGLINNGRYQQAAGYLQLFELSDPQNPDGSFLEACMFAAQGQRAQAITALQKAVKLHYNDVAQLQESPLLASLRGQPEFLQIAHDAENNLN